MASSEFSILDYCVFAATVVLSLIIGAVASARGRRSPQDFLMGGRNMSPVPVAMSLLTSFVSAISLLGISGEAYAHGTQMSLVVAGMVAGIATAAVLILPVIFPLKLTSVNEYIELRFKSSALHLVISLLTCTKSLLFLGVCLYAPTIALVSVTNLGQLTYIFLLGIVCTLYSSFGGIRAVVWTDVFQLLVMLAGLIIVDAVGCIEAGGPLRAWRLAHQGGRLQFLNMNGSLYERHNFYNTIGLGFFSSLAMFGTSQINVQRVCSVKTIKDAQKILLMNIFGMVFINFLIYSGGLLAYATYYGCDPMALNLISKKEQIMPQFVTDKLSFVPGLAGAFVATLVGGTLSSLSSVVSAIVAMVWSDACLKLQFFRTCTIATATIVNKIISLFVGALLIGMAILCSRASSLLDLANTVTGAIMGPVFGVFALGFFFPQCNLKGVWIGLVTSSVFTSWIALGAVYTKSAPEMLAFSDEFCPNASLDITTFNEAIENNTLVHEIQREISQPRNGLAYLYEISYTFYTMIGPIICVAIALIVSCVTGNVDKKTVCPLHISPCLRPLFWTPDELKSFERETFVTEINACSVQETKIE